MVGRRDNDFGVPDNMAAQMLQNDLRRPGGQPRHRRLTPAHPARCVTEYRIDRPGAIQSCTAPADNDLTPPSSPTSLARASRA